jgi:MSHA biogenesis protein MshQ
MRRVWLAAAAILGVALAPPARAEIVYIGSSSAGGGAAATTTLVIARPGGTAIGRLLIAQISHRGGSAVTVSSPGWASVPGTASVSTSPTTLTTVLMYKWATAAEPASYTFTLSSSQRVAGGILSYAGVDPTSPFESVGGQANSAASGNATAPAVNVTNTNSYVAWFWAGARDALTITPPGAASPPVLPAAPTPRYQVANGGGGPNGVTIRSAEARPGATGSTGAKTATLSSSVVSTGQTVLLRGVDVIAEWRFDGCSGAPLTYDSGPYGFTGGSNVNGVTQVSGGQVCSMARFNGTNQYLSIPDDPRLDEALSRSMSIAVWARHTTASLKAWEALVAKGDTTWRLHLNGGCQINGITTSRAFTWGFNGGCANTDLNSGIVPVANTWYHVAVTYNGATARIYVDGVLRNSAAITTPIATNNYAVGIGENTQQTGRHWSGDLDEMKIWARAISATEVTDHMNQTRPCCSNVDHYSVTHATTGVNCQAENVTVVAHDSSHSPQTLSSSTQVTLTAVRVAGPSPGNVGDWTLVSGGGTLDNGAANDGVATYTFSGTGESSVVFALKVTSPGQVVNVSVTDGVATDTSGTASADAGYDQNLTFVASGLRVTNGSGTPTAIGTQIAGKDSNAGFAAQSLALQAIRTDTSTGACVGAFAAGTEVVIEAANQCNAPATCSARQVTLTTQATSNNSAAIANNNGPGAPSSYTSGLRFRFAGAASEAPFLLNYPEAGQISLYFRYPIPLADGSASGTYMSGSSAPFVVRPFGFYTTATGNPGASTPSGAVFTSAGTSFAGSVRAVVYGAGQDANADGVPDSCAALAGNAATPNFSATTTVSAVAPYEPATGTLGTLAHGALSYSSGTANVADFSYSEVGSFTLQTDATDYLSPGVNVTTTCGVVGRFIPDHLDIATNTPQFDTACAAGAFTYLGQPFGYSAGAQPVITATARSATGTPTQNYTGSFLRLTNASVTGRSYTAAAGTLDLSGLPATSGDPAIADLGGGVATLTFSSGMGISFTRTALAAPFDAEIALALDVIDLDGVAPLSNPVTFGTAAPGSGIAFSAGKQLRFGRAVLTSAHGSELLALAVPLRAEYWTGSGFALNAADSCTAVPVGELSLAPSPPPLSTTPTLSNPFAAGDAGLSLSAPGSPGYFDLAADLSSATGAAAEWLRYDWPFDGNSDGSYDDDPQCRATFGIYRGDDPLVYVREVY